MEKPIELILYQGKCHADGLKEGRFDDSQTDKASLIRYSQAMDIVRKYLMYGFGFNIDGLEGIARTEQEATNLINFCEENIGGK